MGTPYNSKIFMFCEWYLKKVGNKILSCLGTSIKGNYYHAETHVGNGVLGIVNTESQR